MVTPFYFKDRDGQTPLPDELKKGLIPLQIQTVGELDEYEESNIAEGLVWLFGRDHQDFLLYQFWLKLHRRLFSKVWKWAGKIREHELQNPFFKKPQDIWPSIKSLEEDMKYWIQQNTYTEKETASRIHERLLTIHPFVNGNGRFSRILVEYISQKQNWPTPTWGHSLESDPAARRREYIDSIDQARQSKSYHRSIKFMYS
jgi:Fic-DOC domain mobile mystery protein B